MSAEAREFAEAASMAMQVQQNGLAPEPALLAVLSVAYSMIEIAESLSRYVNRGSRSGGYPAERNAAR